MSNRKTIEEKIGAAKEEVRQKEARIKELLKQQKRQANKDRNHRLCKRGGLVEKLLPGLALITDEQFDVFVRKCLNTSHTKSVLTELAPAVPAGETDSNSERAHGGVGAGATSVRVSTNCPECIWARQLRRWNARASPQTGAISTGKLPT